MFPDLAALYIASVFTVSKVKESLSLGQVPHFMVKIKDCYKIGYSV
mgnify:CR=1 FL=1|jgi:hypothetical protein